MKSKTLKICLGVVCLALVIAFFIALAVQTPLGNDVKNKTNEVTDSINDGINDSFNAVMPQATEDNKNSTPNNEIKESSSSYILKSYGDEIGIFLKGESVPFKTINVDLRTLPRSDVDSLGQGIEVTGDRDLKRILQDFEE